LQITENKTAGAKAQHDFVALPARLKSCPDAFCSLNGILQEAPMSENPDMGHPVLFSRDLGQQP